MRKFIIILMITVIFTLSACSGEAGWTDAVEDTIPEFIPTPVPTVVLPSGRARNKTFGLAFLQNVTANPITDDNRINNGLYPLIYEGLFELDPEFNAKPLLCSGYSADDGINYTFTLRGNIFFSDGSELTAQDAEYSIKLAQTSEKYKSRLAKIVSVRAINDFTLEIKLASANYKLPALLDIPVIKTGTEKQSLPPGTGPYYVHTGEELYLTRNMNWWRNIPLAQNRIELTATQTMDELMYAFESEAVDLATADMIGAGHIGFQGDFETYDTPSSYMQYLGFNTNIDGLSDAVVRRAIGYAVDRETICESSMLRHALPSALPISPVCKDFNLTLNSENSYSLQKLSAILETGGYIDSDNDGILNIPKNSKRQMEYTLLVNSESTFKISAAEQIAQSLESVGIMVTMRKLRWNDYLDALIKGDFDIYYGEVRLTADFDMYPVIGQTGELNYGKYMNTDITAKLAAYLGSTETARISEAREYFNLFLEEAPVIPILFKNQSVLVHRAALTGLNPTAQNPFYDIANIRITNN